MPLYYFNILNRHGLLDKDDDGMDLPDIEAARSEASRVANELSNGWQYEPPGWLDGMAVEVVNEQGQSVLTVPLPRSGS